MTDLKEWQSCVKYCFRMGTQHWKDRRCNWLYCADPETKQLSHHWKSLPSPQPSQVEHQEFVPPDEVVEQFYYQTVLQHMKKEVHWKCPGQWWNNDWLIHFDSVSVLTALSVQLVHHPPIYSSDSPPPPLQFIFVSKNETTAIKVLFPGHPWNSGTINNFPTSYSMIWIQGVLPAVTEMLGPLHKLVRWQQWWQAYVLLQILGNSGYPYPCIRGITSMKTAV
jgi:hypothetical protein